MDEQNWKKRHRKYNKNIVNGNPYEYFHDTRKNPIQPPIELAERRNAIKITFEIPGEWHNDISKMAKRLKIHHEFLYRKAFQAFFGFAPAVFDDDGYLDTARQVYRIDGAQVLRDHMQGEDDALAGKIVKSIKNKKVF